MQEHFAGLMKEPSQWTQEMWEKSFRCLITFLSSESMLEARVKSEMTTKDMIAAIESFIVGILYFDPKIISPQELIDRRSELLNAIKGLDQYAHLIRMDRIDVAIKHFKPN